MTVNQSQAAAAGGECEIPPEGRDPGPGWVGSKMVPLMPGKVRLARLALCASSRVLPQSEPSKTPEPAPKTASSRISEQKLKWPARFFEGSCTSSTTLVVQI
jgi:hypothetical protein